MKFTPAFIASLLASAAAARPKIYEEGDPLPQTSRVTAFVVDEKGNPTIECWEITNMVENQQSQALGTGKGFANAIQVAAGRELDGLDILTWPASSPIWPIPDDAIHSEWFDLSNTFNLFNIQGGLINFNANFRLGSVHGAADDDEQQHVFSLENGDDWFYFEDQYTGSDSARSKGAAASPFTFSTISSTETETMRLRFNKQPKHKVVHKGACSFTGIKLPKSNALVDENKMSRTHEGFTVQVNVQDL